MEKSTHSREYAALRLALRNARQSAEMSQRDVAARLKVPHSWVAKVETGERRLDLIEFCQFMRACDVDPVPIVQELMLRMDKPASRGGRAK